MSLIEINQTVRVFCKTHSSRNSTADEPADLFLAYSYFANQASSYYYHCHLLVEK